MALLPSAYSPQGNFQRSARSGVSEYRPTKKQKKKERGQFQAQGGGQSQSDYNRVRQSGEYIAKSQDPDWILGTMEGRDFDRNPLNPREYDTLKKAGRLGEIDPRLMDQQLGARDESKVDLSRFGSMADAVDIDRAQVWSNNRRKIQLDPQGRERATLSRPAGGDRYLDQLVLFEEDGTMSKRPVYTDGSRTGLFSDTANRDQVRGILENYMPEYGGEPSPQQGNMPYTGPFASMEGVNAARRATGQPPIQQRPGGPSIHPPTIAQPEGGGRPDVDVETGGGAGGSTGGGTDGGGLLDPVLRDVSPEELSQAQLRNMLQSDSQLMQMARTQGLQEANRRGLTNSSMATQAAQAAMIDRATPFAQQDAQTQFEQGRANQEYQNQFRLQELGAALDQGLMEKEYELKGELQDQELGLKAQLESGKQNAALWAQYMQAVGEINKADMDVEDKERQIKALQANMLQALGQNASWFGNEEAAQWAADMYNDISGSQPEEDTGTTAPSGTWDVDGEQYAPGDDLPYGWEWSTDPQTGLPRPRQKQIGGEWGAWANPA